MNPLCRLKRSLRSRGDISPKGAILTVADSYANTSTKLSDTAKVAPLGEMSEGQRG